MQKLHELMESFIRKKQEDKKQAYNPTEWLDSASKRAPQLRSCTHVIKYSNADAKGTRGIRVKTSGSNESYVSTTGLSECSEDFEGNAASLDVGSFLALQEEGVAVADKVLEQDPTIFSGFSSDAEKCHHWLAGFRQVFEKGEPRTHTLAKQIYFPVGVGEYHLLCPLFSSSLQQKIHECVQHVRYSEEQKAARKMKTKGKYCEQDAVFYRRLAVQSFGGSKPQNISYLNSKRGGRAYLLNSQPPQWVGRRLNNFKHRESFWSYVQRQSASSIYKLKTFLQNTKNAPNNKPIRGAIRNLESEVIDQFLNSIDIIRSQPPGWSVESGLPLHLKLCLDPLLEDDLFQSQRESDPWREAIADEFARRLRKRLTQKGIELEDAHHHEFYRKCLRELKELH